VPEIPNPWLDIGDGPSFVARGDDPCIQAWNDPTRQPEHKIEAGLLPEPRLGCHAAPVVMRTGDPGISRRPTRDHDAHARAEFIEASRRNRCEPCGVPIYVFDRCLADTAAEYWRRVFAQLQCDQVKEERLRRGILVVGFHGCHSKSSPSRRLAVPSQPYGFRLVEESLDRGALIVALRGMPVWECAVPALCAHPVRFVALRPWQELRVSPERPGDDGYERVLAALR
jgi:hypothetical protein